MKLFAVLVASLLTIVGCATKRVEYVRFDKPIDKVVKILRHEELPQSRLTDTVFVPVGGAVIGLSREKSVDGAPRGAHSYLAIDQNNKSMTLRVVGSPFAVGRCYEIAISRDCATCDAGEDYALKRAIPCSGALSQVNSAGVETVTTQGNKLKDQAGK